MLIISFDAVGNDEFDRLMQYPNFQIFFREAATFRDVSTVFLSNTYPIHTSVATGVPPSVHGIISNTEPFPAPHPQWNNRESDIRTETLWQAAAKHNITTAAVLWPVTAYSKTIRYNIPEVLAPPGKSQALTSLMAGSKALQLKMICRHGKILDGIKQPNLDAFSTNCMIDILKEHRPGLALIHLTAYDILCHLHGKGSPEIETAFQSLDDNLGKLMAAAGKERNIILFSDHSQINVHTVVAPNDSLVSAGYINRDESGAYHMGDQGCYFECCGGSAFFHAGKLSPGLIQKLRESVTQNKDFRRFLTPAELNESGKETAAFGFCANAGYCYDISSGKKEKANHGYPLDMPDYSVFYMVRGELKPGSVTQGGSLLDIAPLAARLLGFESVNIFI